MANFFDSQYDLYKFVKGPDVQVSIGLLSRAVNAATGEDFQQDIKDACIAIAEHEKYDFAFEETNILFDFLREKIGVQ